MNLYTTLIVSGDDLLQLCQNAEVWQLPFASYRAISTDNRFVLLFPEPVIEESASADYAAAYLSRTLRNGIVLRVSAMHDDTLSLKLFEGGEPSLEYILTPETVVWNGEDSPSACVQHLCSVFGIDSSESWSEVETLLSAPQFDDLHGYETVRERHAELVDMLQLPEGSVGVGFTSINQGRVPEGIPAKELLPIPAGETYTKVGMGYRHFLLFARGPEETPAQVAGRFSADVISWDDDFVEVEPVLGAARWVRHYLRNLRFSADVNIPGNRWLRLARGNDFQMEAELPLVADGQFVGEVYLHVICRPDTDLLEIFRLICGDNHWGIWDCGAGKDVFPPAPLG